MAFMMQGVNVSDIGTFSSVHLQKENESKGVIVVMAVGK